MGGVIIGCVQYVGVALWLKFDVVLCSIHMRAYVRPVPVVSHFNFHPHLPLFLCPKTVPSWSRTFQDSICPLSKENLIIHFLAYLCRGGGFLVTFGMSVRCSLTKYLFRSPSNWIKTPDCPLFGIPKPSLLVTDSIESFLSLDLCGRDLFSEEYGTSAWTAGPPMVT